MSHSLLIRDEKMGGHDVHEFSLDFPSERISVIELIRSRVFQEVKDFNLRRQADGTAAFQGLIQPSPAEVALNGEKPPVNRKIDWKAQFDKAIEAFEQNQILILVGDRQAESLDQEIVIEQQSVVTFLRLTILVGG